MITKFASSWGLQSHNASCRFNQSPTTKNITAHYMCVHIHVIDRVEVNNNVHFSRQIWSYIDFEGQKSSETRLK